MYWRKYVIKRKMFVMPDSYDQENTKAGNPLKIFECNERKRQREKTKRFKLFLTNASEHSVHRNMK